jgi:hypothetical protein
VTISNDEARHLAVIATAVNDGLHEERLAGLAMSMSDGDGGRVLVVAGVDFHAAFHIAPEGDCGRAAERILSIVRDRALDAKGRNPEIIEIGSDSEKSEGCGES